MSNENYPPAEPISATAAAANSSLVAMDKGTPESIILEGQPQSRITARETYSKKELCGAPPGPMSSTEQDRPEAAGADKDLADPDTRAPCQDKGVHAPKPEQEVCDGICSEERPASSVQPVAAFPDSVPAAQTEYDNIGAAHSEHGREEQDDTGPAQSSEESAHPMIDTGKRILHGRLACPSASSAGSLHHSLERLNLAIQSPES